MLDKGMSVIAGLACRVCMKVTAQYCTSYGRMMLVNSTAPPMMIPLDGTVIGSPMFPCTRAVVQSIRTQIHVSMWEMARAT
jgi:hypothetical protein